MKKQAGDSVFLNFPKKGTCRGRLVRVIGVSLMQETVSDIGTGYSSAW